MTKQTIVVIGSLRVNIFNISETTGLAEVKFHVKLYGVEGAKVSLNGIRRKMSATPIYGKNI